MTLENLVIITPEAGNRLIWREAARALEHLGGTVCALGETSLTPPALAKIFALPPERSGLPAQPGLFFTINFHGLDKFGENASILSEKGVPVAVWCVDNPWNLLSGLRTDFWKKLHLFVTDASFIPGLREHGAGHVAHLPLAADTATFAARGNSARDPEHSNPVVFVGRSAFPDKKRFFVGQTVPGDILQTAVHALEDGIRPDFFWWLDKLGGKNAALWPGSLARRVSLGAEETSLAWKTACLRETAPLGLTIFGDDGWRNIFPSGRAATPLMAPPVDYYSGLRPIYAEAPFSLNMVSFLLPSGLNQRHFDTWIAGGFCLMDNSPGLSIFPAELTGPVTFATARDVPEKIAYFTRNRSEKQRLAETWKTCILADHTYEIRMRRMTETIFS